MKKSIHEIKGTLLSNKQMKELRGGQGYCPRTCGSHGQGTCAAWPGQTSCLCTYNGISADGC